MSDTKEYTKDLISVVIPTYNQEAYIAQTLDSVIQQTYKNIEIIVADDASTDRTAQICQEYALTDNRIKLLRNKRNLGIPANFNRAFDAVSGEYVAFLGGDDLMLPEKVEKQLKFLKKNPGFVLVQSDMLLFDSDSGKDIKKLSEDGMLPTDPLEWPLKIDWHFENKYAGVLPSSCMARSSYYLAARYSDELYLKHELLFTVECYCKDPDGQWGVIDEVLGKYRIHASNFSKSDKADQSILLENFKLAELVRKKCPKLTERANEFEFYTAYKVLLFRNYQNDKEKKIARDIFNTYSSSVQKISLKLGQLFARFYLLGLFRFIIKISALFGK